MFGTLHTHDVRYAKRASTVKVKLANASGRGVDEIVLAVAERLSGPSSAPPPSSWRSRRTHLRGFDREKVSLSLDASQLGPGSYGSGSTARAVRPGRLSQ